MSDEKSRSDEMSKGTLWVVTAVAILAAAAPHAFFAPPLELHMAGEMQQWLGLAVWSPAILAGVAFFFGVEFTARKRRDLSPAVAPATIVILLVLYLGFLANNFATFWTDMEAMRPWGELATVLPLYAALGALQALFFQGFVQHRVLEDFQTRTRIMTVAVLGAVVFAPYFVTSQDAGLLLVTTYAFTGVVVAGAFEVGLPVWGAMLVRAFCGAAFVWFQQAMLL